MKQILINGEDSALNVNTLPRMSDVIELIKSSIDPDHMITGLLLNGRELDPNEWSASTSQFETAVLEVETDLPEVYVAERIGASSSIVRTCYLEFRDARRSFQDGKMSDANKLLMKAVNSLRAFFDWYTTLVDLVPEEDRDKFRIDNQANELTETCKKICQQQLYQSWWALGETIERELEPELDQLEDFCRQVARYLH